MTQLDNHPESLAAERRQMLEQVEDWLETPLLLLALAWLVLLVSEPGELLRAARLNEP